MHIKHCLSSAKAIPIQEAQELRCVDAVASDAKKSLYVDAWLAPWMYFENFYSEFFKMTLQDVYNMPHTFYLLIQP